MFKIAHSQRISGIQFYHWLYYIYRHIVESMIRSLKLCDGISDHLILVYLSLLVDINEVMLNFVTIAYLCAKTEYVNIIY